MPIIIKCISCGFVFYEGKELKSIDDVLKKWDYRCPCCLSTLKSKIYGYKTDLVHGQDETESESDTSGSEQDREVT